MKDARWQLAHDMLQNTSFAENLAGLPYQIQEAVLKIAQSVLEQLNRGEIDALAARFNDPPRETDNDLKKVIRSAIGYAPVPLSIRDHPEIRFEFRTAEDADGLVERIHDALTALPDYSMSGPSKADMHAMHDIWSGAEIPEPRTSSRGIVIVPDDFDVSTEMPLLVRREDLKTLAHLVAQEL